MAEPKNIGKTINPNSRASRERIKQLSGLKFSSSRHALEKYNSYNNADWEHTIYFPQSNGFVVTSRKRITQSEKSGPEKKKMKKEQDMCKAFAEFGFQIEHLPEIEGRYDVFVRKHPRFIVNGVRADLKRTSSHNNIENYAKHAIKNQNAEFVMFEFTSHDKEIPSAIRNLKKANIHGYYFYSDTKKLKRF